MKEIMKEKKGLFLWNTVYNHRRAFRSHAA